jgi:hypothetical protein
MCQDFICESLIWLELERIHNLCKALSIFIALDHSVASFNLICSGIILPIIFRILPKSTTLDFILY